MNKIIFLDVDGVLNCLGESYRSHRYGSNVIEKFLMERLEFIIEKTGAEIVLSSSWHLETFKYQMTNMRFKYLDKIKGRTPRGFTSENNLGFDIDILAENNNCNDLIMKSHSDDDWFHITNRGDQIRQWIYENDFDGHYVVIEDEITDVIERSLNPIDSKFVVETNMNNGMLHEDAMEAISILNQEV